MLLAQSKWQAGLGVDYFQSKLTNIDTEHYSGNFLSDPNYLQTDYGGWAPKLILRRKLNPKWNIETGLGFMMQHSQFHFDYIDNWQFHINTTLVNKFYYLTIPMMAQYNLWNMNQHSIGLGGGLINKVLLKTNSNLADVIFEQIMIGASGNPYVLSSRLECGYSFNVHKASRINLNAFLLRDFTNVVDSRVFANSFFHSNLGKSKYLSYGLGISYIF